MKAFSVVQVAILIIYDICKALDRGMVMGDVKRLEKNRSKKWEVESELVTTN